jgi:hypothetical protein
MIDCSSFIRGELCCRTAAHQTHLTDSHWGLYPTDDRIDTLRDARVVLVNPMGDGPMMGLVTDMLVAGTINRGNRETLVSIKGLFVVLTTVLVEANLENIL